MKRLFSILLLCILTIYGNGVTYQLKKNPNYGYITTYYNQTSFYSTSPLYAPGKPDKPGKDKVCQYCNGTGYINDYGDGELYTGTWYFYTGGYYDGHSCTNSEAYHDDCDQSTYGTTYHHFYKTICPFCNGTGKNPTNNSSWITWNGSAWTHLYTDNDNDGHCDEHWWHTPIETPSIIFILAILVLYISFKQLEDKNEKK